MAESRPSDSFQSGESCIWRLAYAAAVTKPHSCVTKGRSATSVSIFSLSFCFCFSVCPVLCRFLSLSFPRISFCSLHVLTNGFSPSSCFYFTYFVFLFLSSPPAPRSPSFLRCPAIFFSLFPEYIPASFSVISFFPPYSCSRKISLSFSCSFNVTTFLSFEYMSVFFTEDVGRAGITIRTRSFRNFHHAVAVPRAYAFSDG